MVLLKYDREDLYQKIWERPLIRVAEEYGVSAVALGKVCRKLLVPLPGRGHWAKLSHGHNGTRKPPLPKVEKLPVVYRSRINERKPATAPDPEFAAIHQLWSSGALSPAPEAPAFPELHVLIRRTVSRFRSRSHKDERGILLPSGPGGLDLRVTAATLERSIQVMSKICGVLESQDIEIEVSEKGGTVACVNGQRILFRMEEAIRSIVSEKPRVPQPTNSWDYTRTIRYEATGALALVIDSYTWPAQGLRKRWSDGKVQRVEDLIPEFVAGLMRTAVVLRRQDEERKKREEERQQREQERIKLVEQIQAEEKKLEQLNQWVDSWEKAERLRRFIAVYAEKTAARPADRQPHYREWIEWANKQADRLDPFILEKPASVLDRKGQLNWW